MKFKINNIFSPKIYGIIITSLMLLVFGSALISALFENWPGELKEILKALTRWYDDPTGFFFTYMIGYAIIWWKPFLGSAIIILGSILVSIVNIDNFGFLIFAVPTFLVGYFYIESWNKIRRGKTSIN